MFARAVTSYKNSFTGLSRSIWLLSLVALVNRCGSMVLPFLTIYLTQQKGFTLGQAGWAMTCFGVGSAAGAYFGGRLTDKFGHYPVQFWSLMLGGAMFPVLGAMDSPVEVWTTIFVMSLLGESFRPAAMAAISAYSDDATRTRSYSLFRMSINLGFSIGPAVGGLLAVTAGYQALFWVDGLTCIAAALVFRFYLHPSKKAAAAVEKKEEDSSPALSPLRDRRFMFFMVMTTLGAIVFMQFLSTLPVFFRQDLHLSEGEIGLLFSVNGLLIVFFEMPLVRALERKFKQLDCIIWGVAMYGVSYLVFNLPGAAGLSIALLSTLVVTAGEIFNMPFTNAYVSSRTAAANRGRYMGLFAMSFSLAHIFAPTVGMQVASRWGFDALWWMLAAFSAVAAAGFAFLKKKEERKVEVLEAEAVAA